MDALIASIICLHFSVAIPPTRDVKSIAGVLFCLRSVGLTRSWYRF